MEALPAAQGLKDPRSFWKRIADWLLGVPAPRYEPRPEAREAPVAGRVGISCSGGGIRSAAYNLGALQVLQAEGILGKATYMTAVSGGSFMASSYAIVASQSGNLAKTPPLYSPGSPEEQFLRNHASYLAPGLSGKIRLAMRALSGMAVNLGLVTLALFVVARPLGWLYGEVLHKGLALETLGPEASRVAVRDWMVWAAGVPGGLAGLATVWELLFRPQERLRRFLAAWAPRLLAIAGGLAILLIGLPFALEFVRDILSRAAEATGAAPEELTPKTQGSLILRIIGYISGSGLVGGALRSFVARKPARFAMIVGGIAGWIAIITLFLLLLNDATFTGWDWRQLGGWWTPGGGIAELHWTVVGGWIPAATLLGVLYAFADLTSWSIHPFYKRRISWAFASRRVKEDGGLRAEEVPYDQLLPLSAVRAPGMPELIVCAAANVSDPAATPPGRNAVTFTFTREFVGGPQVGRVATSQLEWVMGNRARDLTLPAAVAMSGAAVSPAMGKMTKGVIRFLLALTNIRLGVWLPNPRYVDDLPDPPALDEHMERSGIDRAMRAAGRWVRLRPRPWYLVREALGFHGLNDKFLYVSDGGHYENLGLVELLRRGCTKIWCFDASGDSEETFFTLGEAIALAEAELQVEIDIDPRSLIPEEGGLAQRTHEVGTITYPDGTRGELIFVKATVTDDAPWDVKAFKQKDDRFPNHSTIDQFFNEEKFEAYRKLGEHAAERAIGDGRRRSRRPRRSIEVPEVADPRPAGDS